MSTYYGFKLPKGMHREFADVVQKMSERQGEVPPEQIMDAFRSEYLYKNEPLHFRKLQVTDLSSDTKTDFDTKVMVVFTDHGKMERVEAVGNGPLDAVLRGFWTTRSTPSSRVLTPRRRPTSILWIARAAGSLMA